MRTRENKMVLVLCILLALLVCTKYYLSWLHRDSERLEWDARVSTVYGMPVMLAECDFRHRGYFGNGCESDGLLHGDSSDRWVNCGGSAYNKSALLPDSLRLLYYSFNEHQFRGGSFSLPYEKMLVEARKSMKHAQEVSGGVATKEVAIIAEIHEGGRVDIVLTSGYGTEEPRVVIATLQTKPEKHNWSVFNTNSRDEEAADTSVETHHRLMLEQYNWMPKVTLPDSYHVKDLSIITFWRKNLGFDSTLTTHDKEALGHLPEQLELTWRNDSLKFRNSFYFNQQEMLRSFRALDSPGGHKPIAMKIVVKDDTSGFTISLQSGLEQILLTNTSQSETYNYPLSNE